MNRFLIKEFSDRSLQFIFLSIAFFLSYTGSFSQDVRKQLQEENRIKQSYFQLLKDNATRAANECARKAGCFEKGHSHPADGRLVCERSDSHSKALCNCGKDQERILADIERQQTDWASSMARKEESLRIPIPNSNSSDITTALNESREILSGKKTIRRNEVENPKDNSESKQMVDLSGKRSQKEIDEREIQHKSKQSQPESTRSNITKKTYEPDLDPRTAKSLYSAKEVEKNNDAFVNGSGEMIRLMGDGLDNEPSYDEHYSKNFNRFGFEFGLFFEVVPLALNNEVNIQYNGKNTHSLTTSSDATFIGGVNLGISYYPIYSRYVKLAINANLDGGIPIGATGTSITYNYGANLAVGSQTIKAVGEFMTGQRFINYSTYSYGSTIETSVDGVFTPKIKMYKVGLRYSWIGQWFFKKVGTHIDLLFLRGDPQISPLLVTKKKNKGISASLSYDSRLAFSVDVIIDHPTLGDIDNRLTDDFKPSRPFVRVGVVRRFVF
ncbi:hypothetical protein [Dyadobacter koreensis]|nr:hypothetical protein [Dyadobacter koreensis]